MFRTFVMSRRLDPTGTIPSFNQNDSDSSTTTTTIPSPSPTNNHETAKAIAGGVVGGFLAIIVLICAAAFYRNKRLRDLEEAAHPFIGTPTEGSVSSHPTPGERHHLLPLTLPQTAHHNHQRHQTIPSTISGVTPFDIYSRTHSQSQTQSQSQSKSQSQSQSYPQPYSLPPPPPPPPPITNQFNSINANLEYRDQIRQERQRELNHRLETITTQMRSLKSSYMQDRRRLQDLLQQEREEGSGQGYRIYPGGNTDSEPDPPVIRLVAGGMPDPIRSGGGGMVGLQDQPNVGGEPMVNPQVLADMREQMQVMMDQIQYLRAQQNTPYAQGLTDEPPPGYMAAVNSYH